MGPLATLWTLPPVISLCCLLICGSISGLSLGLKYVRAHEIGIPEVNISVFSTSMLGVSLLLLLYMNVVRRWEDNFDTWPWKQQNSAKSKFYCPFTGLAFLVRLLFVKELDILHISHHSHSHFCMVQEIRWPCAARAVRPL